MGCSLTVYQPKSLHNNALSVIVGIGVGVTVGIIVYVQSS